MQMTDKKNSPLIGLLLVSGKIGSDFILFYFSKRTELKKNT